MNSKLSNRIEGVILGLFYITLFYLIIALLGGAFADIGR